MDEMVVRLWVWMDAVVDRSCTDVVVYPYPYVHAGTDGLALLLVADEDGAVYCTAGNR